MRRNSLPPGSLPSPCCRSCSGVRRGAQLSSAPPSQRPQTFRGSPTATPGAASFGDEKWWEVFQDPQLQSLIRTALQQNYDVRIAASPHPASAGAIGHCAKQPASLSRRDRGGNDQRATPNRSLFSAYDTSYNELGLGFQWDLDFWGKYRRATEAARDQLLANDWAQQAGDQFAGGRAWRPPISPCAPRTCNFISPGARWPPIRIRCGLRNCWSTTAPPPCSMCARRNSLCYTASGAIPSIEKQIEQQENLISTLLGENPGDVTRGLELTAQPHSPEVPAGLPSSLLERRPDIREAEAQLMADERPDRRGQSRLFPRHQPDRRRRLPKHSPLADCSRDRRDVELHGPACATPLRRRHPEEVACGWPRRSNRKRN